MVAQLSPAEVEAVVVKRQIDQIIQLAKLGSSRVDIDPMLDDLRVITASWDGVSPLGARAQKRLTELEEELKLYLITRDPVRRFTSESLIAYLQSTSSAAARARRGVVFTLTTAVLVSGLALLVPVFTSYPFYKSLLLTIPLFFVVLHLGIAWLYLSALANFKSEFRRAFRFVCIGIILLSVAFSHYVIIELLGLSQTELLRYGGLTLLDASCYFFMYVGLRQYAQLVGVTSFIISWRFFLILSFLVVVGAILIPHAGQRAFEPFFDLGLTGVWLFDLFLGINALVAGKIAKSVTPAYAKSMRWLHIYFIFGWAGSLSTVIALPLVGQLNGGLLYILIAVLGIGPQLLMLYTGYSFKKETG